jgi:hypothetical protein
MKLATSKTYILTNAPNETSWKVDKVTIEEILVAKYLGVTFQVRGRSMIGVYEKDMIRKATNYTYAIMNISRGLLIGPWLPRDSGSRAPWLQSCIVWRL